MLPNYKYENKFIIDANIKKVSECLITYEHYHKWQNTLLRVELKAGKNNQENRLVNLIYQSYSGQEMLMTETLIKLDPQKEIIIKYQMGTTVNYQYNYFDTLDDKTVWKVITEFYFESDPPASLEVFKESTKQSLELFKDYVEKL